MSNTTMNDIDFLSILDQLTDGIVVLDKEWRVKYINKAAINHWSVSCSEVHGLPAYSFIPGFIWLHLCIELRKTISDVISKEIELEFENKIYNIRTYPQFEGSMIVFRFGEGQCRNAREITVEHRSIKNATGNVYKDKLDGLNVENYGLK